MQRKTARGSILDIRLLMTVWEYESDHRGPITYVRERVVYKRYYRSIAFGHIAA